jgi:hypothetical protein
MPAPALIAPSVIHWNNSVLGALDCDLSCAESIEVTTELVVVEHGIALLGREHREFN